MRRALVLVLMGAAAYACVDAKVDPGTDAAFQVQGGQFWRGALPSENGGPTVNIATFPGVAVEGRNDFAAAGELDRRATGLVVALEGDVGYWTFAAQVPNLGAPTSPTFNFGFGIAASAPLGQHRFLVRAVDDDGKLGPLSTSAVDITARPLPTGTLVVALTWDTEVDLDLHVVLPNGVELYKRDTTEFQHPPASAGALDPNAPLDGGYLDRDSNSHCQLDGTREEDAIWTEPPPAGHYVVRVDTFSLCAAASANWKLQAILNGTTVGTAMGVATDNDLRFNHDRGAGLTAIQFDVP